MLRSSIFFALIALLSIPATAQQSPAGAPPTAIRGEVVEADSRTPLAAATVAVWRDEEDVLATGAVTDVNGRFNIEGLMPGDYYVVISFVGYETERIEDVSLRPGNWTADLGTIALMAEELEVDGVEVTAERDLVEIGIDRTTYNVTDDPASVGGSVTDVLQNIPSVEVDVDGNVSLRGSQNVAIHVNGRPVPVTGDFLATYLQQLPAGTVERVEVIPNPSARYDPDGMSGIINIVMRQDVERGLGGGINIGAGTNDTYNASGNLYFQRGRLETTLSYGFRYNSRESTGYNFRENRFVEPYTYLVQDNVDDGAFSSHMVNGSLDYNISQRDRLSLSGSIGNRGGDAEGRVLYDELGADRETTAMLERMTNSDNDGLNGDIGLAYRHTVQPSRHEFSAEVRFSRFERDASSIYLQNLLAGTNPGWSQSPEQRTWLTDANDRLSFQVDFVRPIGETTRIELGGKSDLRGVDNSFRSESRLAPGDPLEVDENLTNEFAFDEQVHAAYGIVNQSFGDFEAQLGVRAEQALTEFELTRTGESFDNNYFSVFPSAFLSYSLSDAQTLRASYSKRINRPHTFVLNPFTSYEDPLNLSRGNPYLSPEYTHAFELAYTRFSGATSFTVTPYFRRTVDVIRQFKEVDAEGISVTTFRNMATSDSYGAEAIGSLRVPGLFNAFLSFSAYQVTTDGTNVGADVSSDAFGWSARANATFEIRPGTDVQFFAFYRSPMDIERGRISSFSMSTIALRQKLFDDRANLSLRFADVFDTMGFRFETTGPNFYQESERDFQSRGIFLGFTYNFGRQPRVRPGRMQDQEAMDPGIEVGID